MLKYTVSLITNDRLLFLLNDAGFLIQILQNKKGEFMQCSRIHLFFVLLLCFLSEQICQVYREYAVDTFGFCSSAV